MKELTKNGEKMQGGPYDNLYEDVREQVLGDINILLENLPVRSSTGLCRF